MSFSFPLTRPKMHIGLTKLKLSSFEYCLYQKYQNEVKYIQLSGYIPWIDKRCRKRVPFFINWRKTVSKKKKQKSYMPQVSNCISLIGVAIKYPNLRKIILGFSVEITLCHCMKLLSLIYVKIKPFRMKKDHYILQPQIIIARVYWTIKTIFTISNRIEHRKCFPMY